MAILDTTFLIDLQRRLPTVHHRLQEFESFASPLRVPAAAWLEYLAQFPPTRRLKVARLLEETAVFEPFTREIADEAARLQHELVREGRPLAWHDLQIAATALHFGEDLVSNDRAFQGVPGLAVTEY